MKIRVGFGFDVHQLVAGRELCLRLRRLSHPLLDYYFRCKV